MMDFRPAISTNLCIYPGIVERIEDLNNILNELDVSGVSVQVVKTGITPPLAPSDRFREARTEPLHPAGRLHMRR